MSAPKGTPRWYERGDDYMTASYIENDPRMRLYIEAETIIRETVEECCGVREHAAYRGEWEAGERRVDSAIRESACAVVDRLYDAAFEEMEAMT